MTIHDRIKLVVKWLIGIGVANNQEAIGRLMGYSNKSSFSQILNNKVPIPSDFTDRLCALNDNINKVWIKNETGDMIVDLSTSVSSFDETSSISNVVPTQSDAIIMRLMDKLDEKDRKLDEKDILLKDKETQINHLQSELLVVKEELATLKTLHSKSQDKELDHHTKINEALEAFTSGSSGDSGKDSLPTKPSTASKRSSAGKM